MANIFLFHGPFKDCPVISSFEGRSLNCEGTFFFPQLLQHVALLAPAGPAEGDTFPDPHNALGR